MFLSYMVSGICVLLGILCFTVLISLCYFECSSFESFFRNQSVTTEILVIKLSTILP